MIEKNIKDMTFKDLNELLYLKGLTESQTVEFKREFSFDKNGKPEGKEFAKDITAFANSHGGYLFIGIDEKENEIKGVSITLGNQKIEDWISNVLNDLVDKSMNYEVTQVPISEDESKKVIIIHVMEGKDKPYYVVIDKKPIPYIRKGTSIFAAKPDDIKEMYTTNLKEGKEKVEINIDQKSKGKNSIQVAINQGTIIKTDKITKKNEVHPNPDYHISESQAKTIKDKIDEAVEIQKTVADSKNSNKNIGTLYKETWNSFNSKFKITSYKLLSKDRFEEAYDWLKSQVAYVYSPKLRKNNNDEWRKKLYGSIYAHSQSDWKMSKEQLYKFAFEKLKLKKQILSLKDLNDTNLKKLYKILFSK